MCLVQPTTHRCGWYTLDTGAAVTCTEDLVPKTASRCRPPFLPHASRRRCHVACRQTPQVELRVAHHHHHHHHHVIQLSHQHQTPQMATPLLAPWVAQRDSTMTVVLTLPRHAVWTIDCRPPAHLSTTPWQGPTGPRCLLVRAYV